MGNCARLKWNRKRMGLTQKEFAKRAGLSWNTVQRLETDETAWATIRAETEDRISSMFESMSEWQPDEKTAHKVIQEIHDELMEGPAVEEIEDVEPVVAESKPVYTNGLTDEDVKTFVLMEFAFDGLSQAKTHPDFVANMAMIKRIVNQY